MFISIILGFLLLFLCISFRISFSEPMGMINIFWSFFILGALFCLSEKYVFYFYGINWIILFMILGTLASRIKTSNVFVEKNNVSKGNNLQIKWKLLFIIILLSFVSIFLLMFKKGISLNVFLNFSNLQEISHQNSVERYSSGNDNSLFSQVFNIFIYVSPLCAGYSLVYASNFYQKLICYTSFIPSLLSMLLTSAKLSLISFVLFFFIGFYVSFIKKYQEFPQIKLRQIMYVILLFIIMMMLFFISFILRIGSINPKYISIIVNKLFVYSFGHIQGFDLWFSQYGLDFSNIGFGQNTFLFISSKLGIAEKKQGVYDFISGSSTNIYTQFRAVIEDFNFILGLLILVIVIYLIYFLINRIKLRKSTVFSEVLLSSLLFFNFYFIVSAWTYTTYFFVFIIFYIYLVITRYIKITLIWRKNIVKKIQ
ncbi:O-antigen polymerase [Streptococcus uberis]|uniref:O-antigen polymerase n=1 Tax=Streptococcus uberis TaxID=1349 RepID=UPI00193A7573|nr:O-antigen polymerase [Streptococcus uberis]